MASGHERLAQYVVRDRKLRWRSRRDFARHAGIGLTTADTLERGIEHRYAPTTKSYVEAALNWTDGSFDRILGGGRPSYIRDPVLVELTRLWPTLSRDARQMLLRLARDATSR